MYRIYANNTIKINGHFIPFDLFAESCTLTIDNSDSLGERRLKYDGCGCFVAGDFVVFRGIAVIRKEHIIRARKVTSFKHIRKS